LLSVNVSSNSISADFSFYYSVYSVISQLSRTVPNIQTCILEVATTRIGIELPVDTVYCGSSSLPHPRR